MPSNTRTTPGPDGTLLVSCPHCQTVIGVEAGGRLTVRLTAADGPRPVVIELTFKRLFTFDCGCRREIRWHPAARPAAEKGCAPDARCGS